MKRSKIKKLGFAAYSRSIEPLRRAREFRGEIVGFDTEYTSKQNKLICYQLATKNGADMWTVKPGEKLTPKKLYHSTIKLLGEVPKSILFVTYFSLAELQFLDIVSDGIDVREYANGSLDVTFVACGCVLEVFDLARWYQRLPLWKAAESVGLAKLEYDTKHVTRACLRQKKFREYAIQDAVVQRQIMMRLREPFLEAAQVDPLIAKTPASAAQAVFRRRHVTKKIYCDNNDARRAALLGCWGGRAEVFERGKLKGEYSEYDFSAAYPNAAISLGVLPKQGCWKSVATFRAMQSCVSGFACVDFAFPQKVRYPSLPVEAPTAMLWPLAGRSFCTFPEILFSREQGAKVKIIEAYGYKRGTPILAEFMTWALEQRREAEGAARIMYKLIANSLVGKFAQSVSRIPLSEYLRIAEEYDCYLDELFELSHDELEALGVESAPSVGPVFMPEWNGLITGYTRAALARILDSAGAVYCHTDSIWTRGRPSSDMLPLEKKSTGPATVIRTRFGALGAPITAKGVRSGKCHIAYHSVWNLIAACQIVKKFDGEDFLRKYPVRRPLKFREAIKSGRTPGHWVEEWRCANTLWCGKRRLLPSGNTRPWADLAEYTAWKKDVDKPIRKRYNELKMGGG